MLNLLSLLSSSPTPHLTWYAHDAAERVELSGRVLANWVSKAANLLEDEGVEPGSIVVIALPVHWRAAVWAMAAWLRGARVVFADSPSAHDVAPQGAPETVIVTDQPQLADADLVVAVPLAPLALAWEGPLPAGVVDGAADLMTQADQLMDRIAPDPAAFACEELTFAELLTPAGTARRVALTPVDNTWVVDAVRVWDAGGSVVVLRDVGAQRAAVLAAQEGAEL